MKPIWKWLCVVAGGIIGAGLVVFLATYLAQTGQYVVPPTTSDDPSLPSRNIGGYRFHFEVFGLPTRPVVIVLHGGPGGDYRSLLPLEPLSDEYQVVFYDQRGSGLSPRAPEEQLGLERSLEDLDAIVRVMSPHGRVRLIGHGWGAMLAAAYLDRHPEAVSHAVLAEPDFLTAERGNAWLASHGGERPPLSWRGLSGAWRARMQSLHIYGPDDEARRDYVSRELTMLDVPEHPLAQQYCGADRQGAYLPSWRWGARAAEAVPGTLQDADGRVAVDLVTPRSKRYPHKVLFVTGSCNALTGPAAQRENLALFENAELAIIDDAGHTMLGERPESSLRVLRRYLAEDHSAVVASD